MVYYREGGTWFLYDTMQDTTSQIPWGWSDAYTVLTQYWLDLIMAGPY
jgi:hypothetical protein